MIHDIQDKLRASNVMRWHTVPTSKTQSVAEHSFNVAVMTIELGKRLNLPTKQKCLAIQWALNHDLHEIIDGDVPSPVKVKKPHDWSNKWGWDDVVEFCDILESYQFIRQYAIERHGEHAEALYFKKVHEILDLTTHGEVRGFYVDIIHGAYKYDWREQVLDVDKESDNVDGGLRPDREPRHSDREARPEPVHVQNWDSVGPRTEVFREKRVQNTASPKKMDEDAPPSEWKYWHFS